EREGVDAAGRTCLRELVRVTRAGPSDEGTDERDLLTLAACLNRVGDYVDAEAVARECVVRPAPHPDERVAVWAHCQLGIALLGQGKFSQAEPHLSAGYDGLTRLEQRDRPAAQAAYRMHRVEVGQRIVELYAAWDRPASAAE